MKTTYILQTQLRIQNEKVCCFEICEVNPTLDKENLMAENTFEILQKVVSQLTY